MWPSFSPPPSCGSRISSDFDLSAQRIPHVDDGSCHRPRFASHARHCNCSLECESEDLCAMWLSCPSSRNERDVGPRRVRGQDRPKLPPNVYEYQARGDGGRHNRLLGLLPPGVMARLTPHLEPVPLDRGEMLFRTHEPVQLAYFPDTAVVSLVSTLESGESLEVGLVGRDGLVGTAVLPGITMMTCDGVVQVPGLARRICADTLRREVLANEVLYSTLGRFAQVLLVRSMQLSLCNAFHTVEQRCVRWLLTVSDLIDSDDIPLTHDLMATVLGVRRPTVTLVLRSLHKAGLVTEKRSLIRIRNRPHLEKACCECSRVMRDEQRRLLGY